MNGSANDFEEALEARFQSEHTHIAPEPFTRVVLKRIAAERTRAIFIRRVQQCAALVAVVAASPWLIAGSVRISAALNEWFALVSAWLATPAGMAGAVVAAVVAAALYHWRVWR